MRFPPKCRPTCNVARQALAYILYGVRHGPYNLLPYIFLMFSRLISGKKLK